MESDTTGRQERECYLRTSRHDPERPASIRRANGAPDDTGAPSDTPDDVHFARELRAGVEALGGMIFDPFDRVNGGR